MHCRDKKVPRAAKSQSFLFEIKFKFTENLQAEFKSIILRVLFEFFYGVYAKFK